MIHLHVRSAYTLLKSTIKIEELVLKASQNHMTALALTDKNVMHGAMTFKRVCQKQGIKPIFGIECEVDIEDERICVILLAKNDQGYLNLLKASTYLCTENSILTLDQWLKYSEDCFSIILLPQSTLMDALIHEDGEKLSKWLDFFNKTLHDCRIGICMNDSSLLRIKNAYLKQLCKMNGLITVAMNITYMLDKEDEDSYRLLCAIDQGRLVNDKTLNVTMGRYLRTAEEMNRLYDQDDLAESDTIAQKCQVEFTFKKSTLPHYENRFNASSSEYLRSLCVQGLKKRLNGKMDQVYAERLKKEIKIIQKMNFQDYFLIVYDFIRMAKMNKVYVGPGRGSAPGSLVAYCLGITEIDPIKYDLMFERFLNPSRITMPDIDTDFPDNRREEVIRYVIHKYGNDRVAHIITFQTLAAKAVLRDAGKAMGLSTYDIDLLCKCIPTMLNNQRVTLQSAYRDIPRFRQYVHSRKEFTQLYEMALKLEGLPRHASLHAAGIVLSNQPIECVCPLIKTDENMYATQFTMESLEELGLIKMDFLGIRNLTIIDEIIQEIQTHGDEQFDIMKIPLDNAATYQCIQDVDTSGVFQLESEGMKNLIRQMQPKNFNEIAAVIALFRPGPMENIPLYLKYRQNPELIEYDHPALENILKDTYGVILYQEQIMQIATSLAKFSLSKADTLRYAMSKKKLKELERLRQDFINGCGSNKINEAIAVKIYDLVLKFANYGFNKSHSVAYGLVAYQMAYLKANYPLYFFTALLNSVISSESKMSEYIFEARKRGLILLPPDVNLSMNTFTYDGNAIRYPLVGIKNVGSAIAVSLITERDKNGPFIDFYDFVARMSLYRCTKRNFESLIQAGACDCFKVSRATMIASLADAIRYSDIVKVEDQDQIALHFDLVSKPTMIVVKDKPLQKAQQEKDVLGFYLSFHPLADQRMIMNFKGDAIVAACKKQGNVELLGILQSIRQHKTKKGDLMAFVVLSDETAQIDGMIMPSLYKRIAAVLEKGKAYRVQGKMDQQSLLINQIEEISL